MRSLAMDGLRRMYRPEEGLFAFRLRRAEGQDRLEGASLRYTAIVLIALADEANDVVSACLPATDPHALCGRLAGHAVRSSDLGDVALSLWAARRWRHDSAAALLSRLQSMGPAQGVYPTVEVSWCLTALTVEPAPRPDDRLAEAIVRRLLASFQPQSALFPHWPADVHVSWMRGHVACFADLVYPIQALSQYYRAVGDPAALDAARACARQMCALQGPDGQWWWHYDVRTGRVIEKYPVYAVHQDAMGPMALYALQAACGDACPQAIARSVDWLMQAPELDGSLVDRAANVIWRKVARREPGKLSRSVQAAASRIHPGLRFPGAGVLFPPTAVDYESRPYHMGWILYAWSAGAALGRRP
jgi:hypothetical protein